MTLGREDIGINKSEFVAKIQFVCQCSTLVKYPIFLPWSNEFVRSRRLSFVRLFNNPERFVRS